MEKNQALSVDQCQLQVLQFLVHLINLLNIFLRCNGFAGIQKALVDQTGSRQAADHQTVTMTFGASSALGSALEFLQLLSWSLPIVQNPLFVIHHNPTKKWFVVVA